MPNFRYQPFYQYNGPSQSQPLREELSPEQAKHRIERFFAEIGEYFRDVGAEIEPVVNGIVPISANMTEADCDERVKRCLNSLDLYGRKIGGER